MDSVAHPLRPGALRASSLPMAFRCAGAIRPSQIRLNETNDAASTGTAMHEVLRTLPSTNRIDWDGIGEVALRYHADPDETRLMCALGVKLWNQVKDSFSGAMTEVRLACEVAPGITLTGSADLLAVSQRAMRIGDWKGGRKDSDYSHQFKAYASMALLSSDDIDEATGTGLWVRDCSIENYTLDRAAAQRWLDSLLTRVVKWDGVFRPGTHCAHCSRSHECEAHNALIRRDVAAIADKSLVVRTECEIEQMSAEEIVSVLNKADMVTRYAARVRGAIKAHVERHGDVVAPGVRLTIEEEQRREIDPAAAWPLLEKLGFEDKDFAAAMDLRATRIEKIVATKAGKGNGASAVRALKKALVDAGAVTFTTTTKLQEKRTT